MVYEDSLSVLLVSLFIDPVLNASPRFVMC